MLSIPSTPGDLLSVILFIWVTTNCPNLTPSGPLNFVSGTGNELVCALVKTELKCKIPQPLKIPTLLYSRCCPPVFQPYLEHPAYFLHTHRNSYCLILILCANLCAKFRLDFLTLINVIIHCLHPRIQLNPCWHGPPLV